MHTLAANGRGDGHSDKRSIHRYSGARLNAPLTGGRETGLGEELALILRHADIELDNRGACYRFIIVAAQSRKPANLI